MTDPVREQQLQELAQVTRATRILYQARTELYVNMRFLDVSLSSLGFEADWSRRGLAVDGAVIYYGPDALEALYRRGRVLVNRAYLHMLLHCLFCHMYTRDGREKELWDLACDIAMESVIDGLHQACVHRPQSALRRETYLRIRKALRDAGRDGAGRGEASREPVLTAGRVYRVLLEQRKERQLSQRRLEQLEMEFQVDSHDLWESGDDPRMAVTRQRQWKDNREKMETEMETGSRDQEEGGDSLSEALSVENQERYDYRQFLRRFAVLREEVQVDPDSFDYAFYTYGLSLYGNMPLIEPLETRELHRIEDFVIVIDTSMSCSGELVKRFLEETCDVLAESESYFRKIRIHILQCDDQVRSDVQITDSGQLAEYMEHFEIQGYGGTDFRPAFEYVNGLRARGEAANLRGLIYFTDGKGIYPVQAPPYETAFVFVEGMFDGDSVPAWAMKVVLEEERYVTERGEAHEY